MNRGYQVQLHSQKFTKKKKKEERDKTCLKSVSVSNTVFHRGPRFSMQCSNTKNKAMYFNTYIKAFIFDF